MVLELGDHLDVVVRVIHLVERVKVLHDGIRLLEMLVELSRVLLDLSADTHHFQTILHGLREHLGYTSSILRGIVLVQHV